MTHSYTIVLKIGSSSLVDSETREPRLGLMSKIVETVVSLKRMGHKVVIVSSGGIAVGLKTLNMGKKPKHLAEIQAVAAVGQGRLIARWDRLFSFFDQRIAQILLTRSDIIDWSQYQNAQGTMTELLKMGVVPIVNENDTLSARDIRFGDNDTLSAITSSMVNADFLFLMTDVDCLYTDNPRTNPDAKPILIVPDLSKGLPGVDTSSGSGSGVGTGGMGTKLIAAELATTVGVHTIVVKSDEPDNLIKIVGDIHQVDLAAYRKGYDGDIMDVQTNEFKRLNSLGVPLHTKFIANDVKHLLKDRDFWILHGLVSNGSVIIDEGAYQALTRKNKAGLLPVGILEVEGTFHEYECVDLKYGKRLPNGKLDKSVPLTPFGKARCNYSSTELDRIKGLQSDKIGKVLGYFDSEYVADRNNIAFPPTEFEI